MKAELNEFPFLTHAEQAATPATPGSGLVRVYVKTDGKIYRVDDTGTEIEVADVDDIPADAAAVPFDPTGTNLTATDVQAAIASLDAGTRVVLLEEGVATPPAGTPAGTIVFAKAAP